MSYLLAEDFLADDLEPAAPEDADFLTADDLEADPDEEDFFAADDLEEPPPLLLLLPAVDFLAADDLEPDEAVDFFAAPPDEPPDDFFAAELLPADDLLVEVDDLLEDFEAPDFEPLVLVAIMIFLSP